MLQTYEIAATWAVVGHLFLESCRRGDDGRAHEDLPRPTLSWYPFDWYGQDPCTNRAKDPLWYGDDIVDLLLSAPTPQEIGCHSFSHLIFGDPGCSELVARADIAECGRLAEQRGIRLRSFVFPRNSEGHHSLLQESGFTAYRGKDKNWFNALPRTASRAAHLIDQAAAVEPPVSLPQLKVPGLWNIPGSMVILERRGARTVIPLSSMIAKGKAGLARAVRESKVFHLWLHPFNLTRDPEGMLGVLRAIIEEAVRLKGEGVLDIETMGSLADSLPLPAAVLA
jgi:peptidoglycan/xylan/chitin deacetylase (PgdA/CDA1 family)